MSIPANMVGLCSWVKIGKDRYIFLRENHFTEIEHDNILFGQKTRCTLSDMEMRNELGSYFRSDMVLHCVIDVAGS